MAERAANMKMIIYALLALVVLVDAQLSETPLMIQRMCEENGGNYTAVMVGVNNFVTCVENDFGTVITEVSDAQNSTYAEVFKKYCAKSAQLKTCYHTLLDTTTPCVAVKYQHLITTAKGVTDNALNYVCDNDGTVLTSFITTGGPACLVSKHDENLMCILNLYNTAMEVLNTTWPLVDLSPIVQWYDTYVQCVVTNLSTCESQTPSQVIQRIFEILRVGVVELSKSAASGLAISSGFIGLIVFAAIYTNI